MGGNKVVAVFVMFMVVFAAMQLDKVKGHEEEAAAAAQADDVQPGSAEDCTEQCQKDCEKDDTMCHVKCGVNCGVDKIKAKFSDFKLGG